MTKVDPPVAESLDLSDIGNWLRQISSSLQSIERHLRNSDRTDHSKLQEFNSDHRRFEAGDEYVDLSRTEALILERLIASSGVPVATEDLCALLKLDPVTQRVNIKTYVFRLRAKLASLHNPRFEVQAVRDAGYCAYPRSRSDRSAA